ncbi:hypothetical protein [Luteolibacter marinus]|uniref:hypothetical protein n=1 Tax=Luteolibacter marinus TaxID=2776705 RepID=UPI001866E613|nr:hypothetical protein [Luteolibacter marinus]
MKTAPARKGFRPGYISYIIVLGAGVMLTLLTLSAYRGAAVAQVVQSESQLRIDYADKEDAVLRAMVNIVPNRAIGAMQHRSNISGSARDSLRWQNIFSEALEQANGRSSISANLKTQLGVPSAITANRGDASFTNMNLAFDAIEPEPGYMSSGLNRSLGAGFPAPLETSNSTLAGNDAVYPIISNQKTYGNLALAEVGLSVADYPRMNIIPYPEIRFGYCAPGQPFVAKRNWWAFSMQLGENNMILNSFGRDGGQGGERDFIVSLYEIPSQLAISAEAFTELGSHADGTPWQNTSIQGGIYSTRAQVDSGMHLERIAGRRGLELADDVTIGDNALGGDPFAPGVREQFEVTNGVFMPVTLASEAGRAAFIPINRGSEYFDRFIHSAETNVLSPTSWNNYSVGALQCAMRLDVTGVKSATDITPTALRFEYFKGGTRQTMLFPLNASGAVPLPSGFTKVANENQSYTFTNVVDVAYGSNNRYYFRNGVTGTINFNNATFGDPDVGTLKGGYFRPSPPFELKLLHGTRPSIAIYPKRFPAFLQSLGADSTAVNHSLVVNVDYTVTGINNPVYKPNIPCTDNDYAVLMTECDDLTGFTKGFSLVTNLRLYIGDDFNVVPAVAPAGLSSPFYPPASLFAPEKRYGTEFDPYKVEVAGQIGHLKGDDGTAANPVHLLDFKMASETDAAAGNIDVNLRPITHPAELPPITMMNWLIVVEERRKMFYSGAGAN